MSSANIIRTYLSRSPVYLRGGDALRVSTATAQKIASFSDLPTGWHYGQGGPIDQETIDRAIDLFWSMRLNDFTTTDAFPGANGEIQLTAYRDSHFIGIMIEPNGEYSLVHEIDRADAGEPVETSDVETIKATLSAIAGEIAGGKWNTSVTFTLRTSTLNESVSPRSHSKNQVRMAALPLWKETA
jgi:hypothetical protein